MSATQTALWRVRGFGVGGGREPADVLELGNSGTSARLLAGILASHPFTSVMTGDASLRRRPMQRVIEPLDAHGRALRGPRGRPPAARHHRHRRDGAHRIPPAGGLGAGEERHPAGRPQHRGRDHRDRARGDARPYRAHAAPFRRRGARGAGRPERKGAAASASPWSAGPSFWAATSSCRAIPRRPPSPSSPPRSGRAATSRSRMSASIPCAPASTRRCATWAPTSPSRTSASWAASRWPTCVSKAAC